MKAIMGIYDASLGARSNETSGVAIKQRQLEGDTSTFHFIDNLSRAIQYAGRCLIEIIPSVYSARETIRILGPDEAPKVVKLTQETAAQQGVDSPQDDPNARLYNLATGKYDVTVKAGPSYATRREEAANALIEIIRAQPDLAPIVGDLLVDNLDFPNAPEVAKRLKKMLPPQLQEAEPGQPPQQPQPDPAAMQAQADAQAKQMEVQQRAEIEKAKLQLEAQDLASKQQIEQQRLALEAQFKDRELALREREVQFREALEQARLQDGQIARQEQRADALMPEREKMVAETETRVGQLSEAVAEIKDAQSDLMEAVSNLARIAAAPKRLVRGPDGRPIGAEVVMN
jgi:hypothetical protein